MKKYFPSYAYWGLCALLSIGILKASGVCDHLYGFTHNLDLHGNEEAIREEAERRMREEAQKRADTQYWKEYNERKEAERKEKEERERKEREEKERQQEEERKAWEEYRKDIERRQK